MRKQAPMLLVQLIALIFVIAGIVVIVRQNLWAGVALIAVGVLIFLLRHAIVDGSNTDALISHLRNRVAR